VEHAQHLARRPFPWRTATVVVGAVATVELVALLAMGAARLVSPTHAHSATAAPAHHVAPAPPPPPSRPLRPRAHVSVLVLNGNGRAGAAGREAATLEALGYRIGGAHNAPRHDYARSMVMYVPGWAKEARRAAGDAGIALVAPVDGLGRARLRGSSVVVLLGS
jgi:hypothetical protein